MEEEGAGPLVLSGDDGKSDGVQVVLRVQGGQGDDASFKVGLQVGVVDEEQRPKIRSTVLKDVQRKEELEPVSNRVAVRLGTCAALVLQGFLQLKGWHRCSPPRMAT